MTKVLLTLPKIQALKCPPESAQLLITDEKTPNLGVRLKPRGSPSFIFQGSVLGTSVRIAIARCSAMTIPEARVRALAMQTMINEGLDPRVEMKKTLAATVAAQVERRQVGVTVGDAWIDYLARGTAKKGRVWSDSYRASLASAMHPGGEKHRRGPGVTVPGPLFPLKHVRLKDLDDVAIQAWIVTELARIAARSKKRDAKRPPGYALVKAATEWLSGLLRWCSNQNEYGSIVNAGAARSSKVQDNLPSKSGTRRGDFLEVGQLKAFFEGLALLPNRTMAGYLIGLLLTGARREELAQLKWSDVDFRWKKLTIRDKNMHDADRIRTLPLAPLLERVIRSMPRVKDNVYVFASPKSKLGYVQDSRKSIAPALEHAGLQHLTPHGLRRTFSLIGEAAGCSSGAIEQVMGHAVRTMDEHYKPRSIDILRPVMERLENFVMEQAKLTPHPSSAEGR
jgi:integrase